MTKVLALAMILLSVLPISRSAADSVAARYQAYQERLASVTSVAEIADNGFAVIEEQSFAVQLESFGDAELQFVPAVEKEYHRLVLFLADAQGEILYYTDQLEANFRVKGELEQPVEDLVAVSFQDVNRDGLKDILLIASCVNKAGLYEGISYKIGDVLFQGAQSFYRDWRISDTINRFSMNKSIDFMLAYVRDGHSTEFLYSATTLDALLKEGFQIIEEQCYARNFEKLGRLTVVPGTIHIAEYEVFMIYLVDEQDRIVWSFQPMGDYDNLYALKGTTCRDLDGDGMKDLAVLARYSYEGADGELVIEPGLAIYYQRTGGFDEDREFGDYYQCTQEDTMEAVVNRIREFWGWKIEE